MSTWYALIARYPTLDALLDDLGAGKGPPTAHGFVRLHPDALALSRAGAVRARTTLQAHGLRLVVTPVVTAEVVDVCEEPHESVAWLGVPEDEGGPVTALANVEHAPRRRPATSAGRPGGGVARSAEPSRTTDAHEPTFVERERWANAILAVLQEADPHARLEEGDDPDAYRAEADSLAWALPHPALTPDELRPLVVAAFEPRTDESPTDPLGVYRQLAEQIAEALGRAK